MVVVVTMTMKMKMMMLRAIVNTLIAKVHVEL